MSPPPNPDPAAELAIVRKFLRRNNLHHVVELLLEARDVVHGAKVSRGELTVPRAQASPTTASFGAPEWDSDSYLEPTQRSLLVVPAGLGGRYFVQVALRWLRDDLQPFTAADADAGYFYAFLSKNGTGGPVGNDGRSTASAVPGATGTTQHFTWEDSLAEGDSLELRLQQYVRDGVSAVVHLQLRRVGG